MTYPNAVSATLRPLPFATELKFADFNNRYAGRSCYVVGRGATEFEYADLYRIDDPVFLINDAACLAPQMSAETFFFAHDPHMLPWLDGSLSCTAVLPIDGKVFSPPPAEPLKHAGPVVYYHWRTDHTSAVLRQSRDEIAGTGTLYTHTGTVHSVLHFIWYCGFETVNVIGCDGIDEVDPGYAILRSIDGYDPRLANRSQSAVWCSYERIRKRQDELIAELGLKANYLGTPRRTT